MEDHFTFTPPPECPVFRPSKEEFKDPLEYIEQIRPIAVKTGICKIIPPDDWRPPFSVNVNTFQFIPRVQKLYELEAQSRIKLNFMTKLSQFVRLQGSDKLKVPNINGRHLDLYKLHKFVHENGGYDHVCANKLWSKISLKLGYKNSNVIYQLRSHYEKIILPYDLLLDSDDTDGTQYFETMKRYKPKPVLHPSTTKKRKSAEDKPNITEPLPGACSELKRLQFVGPGPKTFVTTKNEPKVDDMLSSPLKRKCLSDYICKLCGRGDREDKLLICDNEDCQDSYHCDCLVPPLGQVPKQSWKCQNCVIKVLSKKPVEYGFPTSCTQYSLHEFGRSADKFKANYFAKELHELVPCNVVEKEFWRILQSFNDDIIVEYGADIHSSHQGSGFPTLESIDNGKCARNNGEPNMDLAIRYSAEAWNLNVLPVTKRSILRFIRGNIDGMKVPWCYVGMVFSSFCWHIEDHWSYSINYLHWGEPKTWYGVSSEDAEQFELAMRRHAPELFEHQEDLLHHITTIMNPNILMREGVPIYRTDQHAGQFVVTFPRAYHAGFNQGFNFAEAVNFCPANWLPMGRACIDHYANLNRHCVFSHEELLCTIAEAALLEQEVLPDEEVMHKYPLMSGLGMNRIDIFLDTNIRRTVHAELEIIVDEEKVRRARVESISLKEQRKVLFENMIDDHRACSVCQTTCFLSAVQCLCPGEGGCCDGGDLENEHTKDYDKKERRLICLRHIDNVCSVCPVGECSLLYRFTIEEMEALLAGLEVRLQDFHSWEADIKAHCTEAPVSTITVDEANDTRWTLDQLQMRLNEGAECGFDSSEEFVKARALLERGQNLAAVCRHWVGALQEVDGGDNGTIDDASTGDGVQHGAQVPRSVLVDCVRPNGTVEIRNINVAAGLTEDNLSNMRQTLARFPLRLPCSQFEQLVDRLLRWRLDAHNLMMGGSGSLSSNAAVLLPKVVQLFEEAKRLFPSWAAFADERTCLMLIGKSLQWLVRIRECEDSVKSGKTAHFDCGGGALSLPMSLVRDVTLTDLVRHGEMLLQSINESIVELGTETGLRFLRPVVTSLEAALQSLYDVNTELHKLREELNTLPKRSVSAVALSKLKSATERSLRVGVRTKELDDARGRLYRLCVEAILGGKAGRTVDVVHATELMELGSALFAEGVLDKDNSSLTQRHLSARAQIALVTRGIRKLRSLYTGCDEDNSSDLLKILLPRFYSTDEQISHDRLLLNSTRFQQLWASAAPSDQQLVSLMRLYQSMIVEELASIDNVAILQQPAAADPPDSPRCCVCNACIKSESISGDNNHHSFCAHCNPRSQRPSINEIAQLNKLLKQCPNIISLYGVALQAVSKRVVTWLESLVALIRLHVRFLSAFYGTVRDQLPNIPVCIKELFCNNGSNEQKPTNCSNYPKLDDLLMNLRYLRRVGYCLEVNVTGYIDVITSFINLIDSPPNNCSSSTTTSPWPTNIFDRVAAEADSQAAANLFVPLNTV